jgi:hypothetical protein
MSIDMCGGEGCRWIEEACAEAAALRREVERLAEDLRVARSDAATCGMIADRARREAAALKAEVKAMREVESDARRVVDHWRDAIGLIGPVTSLRSDLDALDALRTRKDGE